MEINPFLGRELRTRWRGKRAYWNLFWSAAAAAILVCLLYWQASALVAGGQSSSPPTSFASLAIWLLSGPRSARYAAPINPSTALTQFGHSLFLAFAWLGTVGWLLQGSTLTAAAIAGEREQGSLEALQLSPLGPTGILAGKLAANLLYAAIIYLAALPLAALSLLLTGVSLGQFCLVVLVHACTGVCGALVGLAVSASSHRTAQALRSSKRRITLWFCSTLLVAAFSAPPWTFASGVGSASTPQVALRWLLHQYTLTNPVFAVLQKLDNTNGGRLLPACFCLGFQLVLGIVLFKIAARNVGRPLDQPEWVRWRKAAKPGSSGSLFALPGMLALNFGNPILTREFRSKFRMRYPPMGVIIFEALLALVVAGAYLYIAHLTWTQPTSREYVWTVLAVLAFGLGAGACGLIGATNITRERENGTWEGLQLALLSPTQVLRGKWQAALLSCVALSLPLWPLLLLSLKAGSPLLANTRGVHPAQLISLILVLASGTFMACALGLCFSAYRKASSASSNATMLSLMGLWLFLPIVLELVDDIAGEGFGWERWPIGINPFKVLLPGDHSVASIFTGGGLTFTAGAVALGALFLRLASRRVEWEWRLRDAGTGGLREP